MALLLVPCCCRMHEGSFITSREGQRDRRGGGRGDKASYCLQPHELCSQAGDEGCQGATLPCINVYFRRFWSGSRFMYCGTLHHVPLTVSGHSILLGEKLMGNRKNLHYICILYIALAISRTLALSCKCLNALNRLLMRLTSAAVWPRLDVVSAAFHPCFNTP